MNKAREYSSPLMEELVNETTPEELEKINKEMKEIIGYVLGFIFVIYMTLGLFGAFDKDKDNPFINKK